MNYPQLVMHEGFYCGHGGDFFMPKSHRLKEYCYDGSHELNCAKCGTGARLTLTR